MHCTPLFRSGASPLITLIKPRSALFLLLLFSLPLGPEITSAQASELEVGGEVGSSFGAYLFSCQPDCFFLDYQNRNVVDLYLNAYITPEVTARAALSLRNENIPQIRRAEDTGQISNLQPFELRITDAWVEGHDFLVPGLDLRVGAQTIQWGTGDGFSPSNRLSPVDLSDPTFFDRRLATPATLATYHRGDFTFSAAWIPFFLPATITPRVIDAVAGPDSADDIDFDSTIEGDPLVVDQVRTRIELPIQRFSESAYALRVHWAARYADLALGYYYGRDHLPQLSGEVIPENFFDGETTDLVVNLRYPRLQMLAAEARAPIGESSWTAWVDGALIFPARTRIFITQSRLQDLERLGAIDEAPDEDITAIIQTGEPYLNFMVGADTSLGSHLYLNFQYLRGFLFERNPSDLHHYLLVGVQIPNRESPLNFEARLGAEATSRFDAFGALAQLRLSYLHGDALEVFASSALQMGQTGTTLGRFAGLSEVRIGASAHF